MSKHEFKPGDVAMGIVEGERQVALVVKFNRHGCPEGHRIYPVHAHLGDGDWSTTFDLRPLVVVDPGDREQVSILARTLGRLLGDIVTTDDTQAALREFANPTPPKPAEPLGLGAVVEDVEGKRWVRSHTVLTPGKPWTTPTHSGVRSYDNIAAVRVLSEGVTE